MQWERTTLFGCWVAAAAASLQSCPTLCDPIDGSPPGSPIPEILQARTLEWVAISFSNAWKWICSVMFDSVRPHGLQLTRLLHPWDFPGKSTAVGCHCLLRINLLIWSDAVQWLPGGPPDCRAQSLPCCTLGWPPRLLFRRYPNYTAV